MHCTAFSLACLAGLALVGCVTPQANPTQRRPQDSAVVTTTPEEMEAAILEETKKTAAEQLGCPVEDVRMRCTNHDAQGGCVAVQAKGCEKTLDYSFGSE